MYIYNQARSRFSCGYEGVDWDWNLSCLVLLCLALACFVLPWLALSRLVRSEDGKQDGRKDGRMDGRMEGWKDGWMDGWKDGWKDGWIGGRNGGMDRIRYRAIECKGATLLYFTLFYDTKLGLQCNAMQVE